MTYSTPSTASRIGATATANIAASATAHVTTNQPQPETGNHKMGIFTASSLGVTASKTASASIVHPATLTGLADAIDAHADHAATDRPNGGSLRPFTSRVVDTANRLAAIIGADETLAFLTAYRSADDGRDYLASVTAYLTALVSDDDDDDDAPASDAPDA